MSRRTPGPWALRGYQIRSADGHGQHVADYRISAADGLLIAAAPTLLEMLLDQIACGEACGGGEGNARSIKERLAQLGLVRLGYDEQGNESERVDLLETDPDINARAAVKL